VRLPRVSCNFDCQRTPIAAPIRMVPVVAERDFIGAEVMAAVIIDRPVPHAHVIDLCGVGVRLWGTCATALPSAEPECAAN
jgi:hypothetical protein